MVKNPLSLTGLPLIRALLFDNFPGRTFVWPHAAARIPRPPRKKDTTAGGGGRTTGALWSEGVTSTQPFGKDVRNVPGTKTLCFRSFPLAGTDFHDSGTGAQNVKVLVAMYVE